MGELVLTMKSATLGCHCARKVFMAGTKPGRVSSNFTCTVPRSACQGQPFNSPVYAYNQHWAVLSATVYEN